MRASRWRCCAPSRRWQGGRGDSGIVVGEMEVQRVGGGGRAAAMAPKAVPGVLRTSGPAGGRSGGGGGGGGSLPVVQRGGGGGWTWSALPVVQGAVEAVTRQRRWRPSRGDGLVGGIAERRRLREVLGFARIWLVAFQVGILGVRLRARGSGHTV